MSLDVSTLGILWPALVAGLLVTLSHVPLGMQVLKRGIVFIDLAVAQVAGVGVILADFLGWEPTGVPAQAPPEQMSPIVHAKPSLQVAWLLVKTQPVAGSQESSVHGLLSLQVTAHCVTAQVVVVISRVQAVSDPPSAPRSSLMVSVQVPFGSSPMNAASASSGVKVGLTTRFT